ITVVETSGPRAHCFWTQEWWMERLVVVLYLRNSERVLPARKHHCTVTSCAPNPIEMPSSPEPVDETWLKTTLYAVASCARRLSEPLRSRMLRTMTSWPRTSTRLAYTPFDT